MTQIPSAPLPGLGSLAQSARAKELRSARNILIAVGVLTIIANIVFIGLASVQIDDALKAALQKQGISVAQVNPVKYNQAREAALRVCYLINGGGALLGVVFLILAAMIRSRPVV